MNNVKTKNQQHPNIQVLVFNKGPIQPELKYDGVKYFYEVGKATPVPAVVAFHHYGVDYRSGRMIRRKEPYDDGQQSQYISALGSLQPMSLVYSDRKDKEQYKADQTELKMWHEWFDKGLVFEATGTTEALTEDEFLALRKQKKQ